jgi:hypothetical protein
VGQTVLEEGVSPTLSLRLASLTNWVEPIHRSFQAIGSLIAALWARQLFFARGLPVLRGMFDFGIELATDQDEEAGQIHPGEQHDHGTDGAIGRVIRANMIDIEGKTQRGEEPADDREHRARRNPLPLLPHVGSHSSTAVPSR